MHSLSVMNIHPVQLHIEPSAIGRVQVLVRVVVLAALATLGCSSLYWALYLALPAMVALAVSRDGGEGYLAVDAPRVIRVLRWLAEAYAYLWMLTDSLPGAEPGALTVEVGAAPSVSSSLWRLLTSLPALLVLAVLSMVAGVLWVAAAVYVLLTGRMPSVIREFILTMLRYQFRLVAYHASLVDIYPTIVDSDLPHAPHSI